jgi:hypothetical protein
MMFDATRFMAAPGLARILAYGVQMLVLGVISGIFFMTLDGLDLGGHLQISQSLALLTVMLFFGLLFKYATDIAREQISGMPSLGLHDIGRMGTSAAMTGASMLTTAGLGALGTFAGMRLSLPSFGSGANGLPGAAGGSVMSLGLPGGGMGASGASSLPRAAARLLENPNYTSWAEARDLPRSAQRLLSGTSRNLPPPPPPRLPPPRS